MKKGNLVLAAICAVMSIGIIVVASDYPTAADYGTGVPGPGLWPIVISIVLLKTTPKLNFGLQEPAVSTLRWVFWQSICFYWSLWAS